MLNVTIQKTEAGFHVMPSNHTAKDLREAELWVRANFWVVPEEWIHLKADLVSTGKAHIVRSAGKGSQVA